MRMRKQTWWLMGLTLVVAFGVQWLQKDEVVVFAGEIRTTLIDQHTDRMAKYREPLHYAGRFLQRPNQQGECAAFGIGSDLALEVTAISGDDISVTLGDHTWQLPQGNPGQFDMYFYSRTAQSTTYEVAVASQRRGASGDDLLVVLLSAGNRHCTATFARLAQFDLQQAAIQ